MGGGGRGGGGLCPSTPLSQYTESKPMQWSVRKHLELILGIRQFLVLSYRFYNNWGQGGTFLRFFFFFFIKGGFFFYYNIGTLALSIINTCIIL